MLSFTEDPGTDTKDSFEILLLHERKAFGREYEPGVDESIDIGGLLIDGEVSRWVRESDTFRLRVPRLLGALV
jgi:hypothetical protein